MQYSEVFLEIKPLLQQLRTYRDCFCKQVSMFLSSTLIVATVNRRETERFSVLFLWFANECWEFAWA